MKVKVLLFIAMFTITIGGIGVDLYSPSLPWIAQSLKVEQSLAKYTITIFLVGFALGQILFGFLSQVYGRKSMLCSGLLIFVVVSLLAAFSPNIQVLMVLRFIQGVGAASCSVISKAMLTDVLKGQELRKAMTSMSIAWATGPNLAPVVGGYLQHHFNWHANFYFYAAYSGLLLVTVLMLMKETLHNKIELKYSILHDHYMRLFKHSAFVYGIITLGLGYSLIIAFNVMGPFIIQRTLHYGPIAFGHMALFVGLAFFLGTSISRLLVKAFSPTAVIQLAVVLLVLLAVGYVVLSYFIGTSLVSVVLPTFLIITVVGLIFPNVLTLCMGYFVDISGIASSMVGCVSYLTTTLTSSAYSLINLPDQRPYAWTLMGVIVVIAFVIAAGFVPSANNVAQEAEAA